MKTKNKKILISALCSAMAGSVGIGLATVQTANADYLANSLTMIEGASIYLGDVSGIRYSYTTAYAENTNYGMLIVPEDYLLKSGIEIGATTDYVTALKASTYLTEKQKGQIIIEENLVPDGYDTDNLPTAGTSVTFKHAIGDLYQQNYDRRFFGIGFIKNGDNYTYAENNDNVRSIMYVASAALNDYAFDYENLEEEYQTSYGNNLNTLGAHVTTGISNVTDAFEYSVLGETEMTVGDTQTLTVDNARQNNRQADLAVYWTSGDEEMATVENGEVTAIGAGAVSITAKTSADGVNATYQDSITINVKQDPVTLFNGMVASLDSETPDYATMETAYNLYGTMTTAQQEEVATNYQTLWNLIPKVLDDTALVDYSNTLAVAYNAKGGVYGKDQEDTESTLMETLTNSVTYSYTNEWTFADDNGGLAIDSSSMNKYKPDGVTLYDAVVYALEILNNADHAGKKIGFYVDTYAGRRLNLSGDVNPSAFTNYTTTAGSAFVWTFVTGEVSSDGKAVLNVRYYKEGTNTNGNVQVNAGLNMNLTSVYEVSASYVDTLIKLYEAETDEAKKAQYQTKILDFYNALSEEEQANVTKMTGLFNAYSAGLSATSTDDELIVGLNLYRSMSATDQATVANSYATLQGLIESRLDTTALVDYGSALAVAYNASGAVYGNDNTFDNADDEDADYKTAGTPLGVQVVKSKTETLTYTFDTSYAFADGVGGLVVNGPDFYANTTYDGVQWEYGMYFHDLVKNTTGKDITIGFYVKTNAANGRYVNAQNAVSFGNTADKITNTGWTFFAKTVKADEEFVLRVQNDKYKSQVIGGALVLYMTSIYEITADYVNELLTEWQELNEAGDAKATEYATKINDFYGALTDKTGVDTTLYEAFVSATTTA